MRGRERSRSGGFRRCSARSARRMRGGGLTLMIVAGLLAGCGSGTGSRGTTTATKRHTSTAPTSRSAQSGVPRTYQQACMQSGGCVASGPVPAVLVRPLHFPADHGSNCRASPGGYVATPDFGSMAVGTGPVRVAINNAGSPRRGFYTAPAGDWLAIKTHFFSSPSYTGPFLVRAERLDRPGPIELGATPTHGGPLVVPPGAYAASAGWREVPYFTFVRTPGCYAWQVDGLTFSTVIVVHLLGAYHGL